MLACWAPRLLREMHERDVRRPYCPPALWLGPFLAAESAAAAGLDGGAAAAAEERFSAAAVMRALLQGPPGSSIQARHGSTRRMAVPAFTRSFCCSTEEQVLSHICCWCFLAASLFCDRPQMT